MMKSKLHFRFHPIELQQASPARHGAFLVLAIFCLMGCLAFAALSIDVGYLGVTKLRMQNAVDAAALAAVQEISNAIRTAPMGTEDVTSYSLGQARTVAADVARLNKIYVDPQTDVFFGQRTYDASTETYSIQWGVTPANTVKVVSRRTEDDVSASDGKLPLFFAGVIGDRYANVQTEAIAYVEARDMVVVHDFSRSMNFDSQFSDEAVSRLSDAQIVSNLSLLWDDLMLHYEDNVGALDFDPLPLTLSDTRSGVSTSVTFRYDDASITTSGELQSVKLRYSNNRTETFSASGNAATIDGSNDISSVTVTVQSSSDDENEEVTLSSNGIDVSFSSDRESADISSEKRMASMRVYFQDGSSRSVDLHNAKSYSYSRSKPISSLKIDLKGGRTKWIDFDPEEGGSGSAETVVQQFDDTNSNVEQAFGLDETPYPFPYGSWDEFIDHCRDYDPFASRGYRETYGGLTFANYLLRERSSHAETPALAQARHYPFSSIKQGHALLCDFLANLGFDDQLGMVSYDNNHRVEKVLQEDDPTIPLVDISSDPISADFVALNNLMKYKQANHYSPSTNMGGGLEEAIDLLNEHARAGTRPTIILMTDGNSNVMDRGASGSLPRSWDWDKLFDYDDDDSGDYYTSSTQARYVLMEAYEAYSLGYTVHAMSVGMDADRDLLRAIAHLGGGIYIDVPGGASVSDMEDQILEGFHKIASQVPPAKLITSP
jgi:Flp pilus assembly protein TadG